MGPRASAPTTAAVYALLAGAAASLGGASVARAQPQVTTDLSLGGGVAWGAHFDTEGRFAMALRADVLFGPRGPTAFRVGPWLALRSDNADDLVPAAGLSLLVPVSSTWPLVLSAGGAVDVTADAPRLGLVQRVWWGSRPFNYHSVYGMSAGFWLEARQFPRDDLFDVALGVDVDLEAFALPVVLLINWFR